MNTTEEKGELNLITLAQQYSDDDKARELLESLLWPQVPIARIARPICPINSPQRPPASVQLARGCTSAGHAANSSP